VDFFNDQWFLLQYYHVTKVQIIPKKHFTKFRNKSRSKVNVFKRILLHSQAVIFNKPIIEIWLLTPPNNLQTLANLTHSFYGKSDFSSQQNLQNKSLIMT